MRLTLVAVAVCFLIASQSSATQHPPLSKATTNYASSYLGAKVMDHHPSASGAHHLLHEDRDKYMLIPCAESRKQWTVQLSREVELSVVSVVNLEYFSSTVRHFTLLGSKQYPCRAPDCMWRVMGSFEAQLTRQPQHFVIAKQPAIRYLRFQWVTQHGSEKSCAMTTLQAYGTDVLESLAAELSSHTTDVDDDDDVEEEVHQQGRTETQYVEDEHSNNETLAAVGNGTESADREDPPPRPVKQWRPITIIFPPRNVTLDQNPIGVCVAGDRDTMHFYERGPGARCYKKPVKKEKPLPTGNILAIPHFQRQLKSLQQEFASLQQEVTKSNRVAEKALNASEGLRETVLKELRSAQQQIKNFDLELSRALHTISSLSTQWELQFNTIREEGGGGTTSVFAMAMVAVISGVVMFVGGMGFGRSSQSVDPFAPMTPLAQAEARPTGSPIRARKNVYPLSGSSANLTALADLSERAGGSATPDSN